VPELWGRGGSRCRFRVLLLLHFFYFLHHGVRLPLEPFQLVYLILFVDLLTLQKGSELLIWKVEVLVPCGFSSQEWVVLGCWVLLFCVVCFNLMEISLLVRTRRQGTLTTQVMYFIHTIINYLHYDDGSPHAAARTPHVAAPYAPSFAPYAI
jgi:hypothetical protein